MATLEEKRLEAKRIMAKKIAEAKAKRGYTPGTPMQEMWENPPTDLPVAGGFTTEHLAGVGPNLQNLALGALAGAGQAATMGYGSELGAGAVAPFSYLSKLMKGEEASLPEEYTRLRDASKAADAEAMGKSPIGSAIGMALGLAPEMKGAALMEQGLREALPLGGSVANKIAAATGVGGLLGGAWNPGEDQSRGENAVIGALAGGVSEGLFNAFRGLKRAIWPNAMDVKEAAANRLFGDVADMTGADITPGTLAAVREGMGPEAIVADLHPIVREHIGAAIIGGAEPKAVGKLVQAANTRDPEQIAWEAIQKTLGTEKPRFVNRQEQEAVFKELGAQYRTVLGRMDEKHVIPPKELFDAAQNAFGATPIGASRTYYNQILDAIGTKAEGNPTLLNNLKPSDVVAVKQMLDGMLDHLDDTMKATAPEKQARVALSKLRNDLKSRLNNLDPEFAGINKAYGGEFEFQRARELGEKLMANPTKQTADDMRHEFEGLSLSGQQAFREGAGYSLFLKAQAAQSGVKAAEKLTGAPSYREALNTVFGEASADRLVSEANRISAMFETNEFINAMAGKASANLAKNTAGTSPTSLFMDLITAAATASAGNIQGGAFLGSAKRTGVALTSAGKSAVNTELTNLGSMQGADADAALGSLYDYMHRQLLNQPFNPALPVLAQQNRPQ